MYVSTLYKEGLRQPPVQPPSACYCYFTGLVLNQRSSLTSFDGHYLLYLHIYSPLYHIRKCASTFESKYPVGAKQLMEEHVVLFLFQIFNTHRIPPKGG